MKTASGYIMPHVPYVKEDNKIEHEYVEIAGIKWATMNIGAESITDTGLYFQWGDTQGYTAEQVGTDKMFNLANYKYSDNGTTAMTKYKGDDYTVLQPEDDAVTAAWGGSWRMPTTAEFQTLGAAVTSAWTTNYQGVEGCNGLLLTGKNGTADEGKTLFFPACGYCYDGSVDNVGSFSGYWSSSLFSGGVQRAYNLYFGSGDVDWQDSGSRYSGCAVRGVLDGPVPKFATPSDIPAQVQSDWGQSDSAAIDYIKNKPDISALEARITALEAYHTT